MPKRRLDWEDSDWASYLGCPVAKIPEYKKMLSSLYLTSVAQNQETGKYRFEIHGYDIAPSGQKRIRLLYSGKKEFDTGVAALKDANSNIIPKMQLTEFWTKQLGIPAKAIQMLLIREK